MSQNEGSNDRQRRAPSQPRQSGFFGTLLWPEAGASHSYQVMLAESHWLSEGYTRSLLMSAPVQTTSRWMYLAWQWLFVDSGFSQ